MVHLSCRHHKVRIAKETNQTSPFHLGPVGHIARTVGATVQIKHDVASYLTAITHTLGNQH